MSYCSAAGLSGTLFPGVLFTKIQEGEPITIDTIAMAEKIAGVTFTDSQREMLVEDLIEHLDHYQAIREMNLSNGVAPAFVLKPFRSEEYIRHEGTFQWQPKPVDRPTDADTLAYLSVAELSYLLKNRLVTSMELVDLYMSRLRRYDDVLQAVVTYTEELARKEAADADRELDAGDWRGPLHGVPYGAKDLLSVKEYRTTWGAQPYEHQVLDEDATVVKKLREAGAVLLAKLSLGALAWGDVWYKGQTKNPWNIEQGSSGSSAGPGATVAAGLVGFAIGSETHGSIVSPSTRNGITGFRPSFGTVSRFGAMTLSWTMDKLGPMARSAEDCALIYEAIRGYDPRDATTLETSFPYNATIDITTFRIGYLRDAFEGNDADKTTLETVRKMGVSLIPVAFPDDQPVEAMLLTLDAEAAAAFDELTRSGGTDEMVRQTKNAWPHVFRRSRLMPAVEFIQANRARTLLMQRVDEALRDVDVLISPSFRGGTLAITNLTGHPCVCLPNAFRPLEDAPESPRKRPSSITFIGNLYKDAEVLLLARAYQRVTDFHRRRPPIE